MDSTKAQKRQVFDKSSADQQLTNGSPAASHKSHNGNGTIIPNGKHLTDSGETLLSSSTRQEEPSKRRAKPESPFPYPEMPKWEMRLYWTFIVFLIGYAYYCVHNASRKFNFGFGFNYQIVDLPLFGKTYRDYSNWEWTQYFFGYLPKYFPMAVGHCVVFNVGERLLSKRWWEFTTMAYSMAASAYFMSPWLLLVTIVQGVFIFAIGRITNKTAAVWLASLPVLYAVLHRTKEFHDDPFLVLTFTCYTLISYISFNLELLKGNGRPEDNTNFKLFYRMFYYAFYIPYLTSLIVLYPDFERQLRERSTRKMDWNKTIKFAARIAFWTFFTEAIIHFWYPEAMLQDLNYAYDMRKDTFVCVGMAVGAFFHLKYVVIFGIPSVFARLDNMQPLQGPICISRVSLYSNIWRYFDRGLYAFFKEYIFKPICYPTFSIPRKIAGLLLSYTFVLVWHGPHHNNCVWIALNIIEILIEYAARGIYSIPSVKATREKYMSAVMFRRVLAWLQIVPFVFGLYSNFYFLLGSEVGYMFVERIWVQETVTLRYPFFLLICCGYGFCHVTMEIDRLASEREKRENEEKIAKERADSQTSEGEKVKRSKDE